MRRRVNRGRHVHGSTEPERVPWWDLPGVFALLVVVGGIPVFLGVYALAYLAFWGEWPTW